MHIGRDVILFAVIHKQRSLAACAGVHESSVPVAHPGYLVLSDILFRLGLIANALTQCSSYTVENLIDVTIIVTCFGPV